MKRIGFLLCFVLAAQAVFAEEKVRVFIADSDSWAIGGAFGGKGGGGAKGGARPQTVEIMKTFRDNFPITIVTIREDRRLPGFPRARRREKLRPQGQQGGCVQ